MHTKWEGKERFLVVWVSVQSRLIREIYLSFVKYGIPGLRLNLQTLLVWIQFSSIEVGLWTRFVCNMQCWHWIPSFINMYWILSEIKHLDRKKLSHYAFLYIFCETSHRNCTMKQCVLYIHMKKDIFQCRRELQIKDTAFQCWGQTVANSIDICITVIMSVNKSYK